MSLATPIRYGEHLYALESGGPVANLYASSTTVQAFTLTLSEAITDTDARVSAPDKIVSETMTLTEADVKSLLHVLSDSVTETETFAKLFSRAFLDSDTISADEVMDGLKLFQETITSTDAKAISLARVLADTISHTESYSGQVNRIFTDNSAMAESRAIVLTVKSLPDFLILKEWVSIRLQKQTTWTSQQSDLSLSDSVYARSSAGPSLYMGKNMLYGGLKSQTFWVAGTTRPEAWTNTDGHKYIS